MRFVLSLLAGWMAATPVLAQESGQRLVTVVTTADPQTQLMAMVLTLQALQQGASAHLLLCGPGGDLALKTAPASATAPQKPRGQSPQGLLRNILAHQGAAVELCAIYLPNARVDRDAILDGVGVAKPPDMTRRLLSSDTRVLSF